MLRSLIQCRASLQLSKFTGQIKRQICCSCALYQDLQTGFPTQVDTVDMPGTSTGTLSRPPLPLMTSRKLQHPSPYYAPKQAWLETLATQENEKLGIIDLHPTIFGVLPRPDLLWWNIHWQKLYKRVNWDFVKNRAEMKGGGRKPWPQKGSGRARHGSIRSPLFHGGGKSFGPRGPKSYFFMLSIYERVHGLTSALSAKYAQDNLHIVDSLDIPSQEPQYLRELVESRGWGLSVLFIDDSDILPENFAMSINEIKPYTSMPVYGLNVYSMLKHETLVLTVAAVEKIEEKLLKQMHKPDAKVPKFHPLNVLHTSQPYNPKS